MRKTNEADFERFKEVFVKWCGIYGLTHWDIRYTHGKLSTDNAHITCDTSERWVDVRLATRIDSDVTIDELAFHEATELLLIDMSVLIASYPPPEKEAVGATHAVINRLMNAFKTLTGGL